MDKRDKINIKARINRHLRIARSDFLSRNSKRITFSYSLVFVLVFVTFIFPIYPSIASIIYKNTEYDFYRGDIDESSILQSYMYDGGEDYIKGNVDSFISINTILKDDRDTSGSNEIIKYTVKSGESYESIASDFGVSVNSILWANSFSNNHVLHPGNIIKIPPVTGLVYKVKKGDTLEKLAYKYDIKLADIEKQNSITKDSIIVAGQELILPGAKKIIPKIVKPKNLVVNRTKKSNSTRRPLKSSKNSSYSAKKGTYKLIWRSTKRNFAWGNCTYFVSHYKNVTWRGNANQWIRNASAKGVPTGYVAKPGAIVQFSGRGYNPRYGHVGIVTEVSGSSMIVADMNYRAINEVTYRRVPLNSNTIDGYIYTD